jgi:hypothetical protein
MTEQTGFPAPDPQANRDQWLADHPQAQEVTTDEASGQVAAQLGAQAPGSGVSDQDLGQQMAASGAQAGLPYEDTMNALMDQVKAMGAQIVTLQERDRQREQAQIAMLGEPILQRYANAIRDHLKAHQDANPGLGPAHFGAVIQNADRLSQATSDAISRGANDLGQVRYLAGRIDHFLTKGHKRTAPAPLAHGDMSAVGQALEYLMDEVDRLSGAQAAIRA